MLIRMYATLINSHLFSQKYSSSAKMCIHLWRERKLLVSWKCIYTSIMKMHTKLFFNSQCLSISVKDTIQYRQRGKENYGLLNTSQWHSFKSYHLQGITKIICGQMKTIHKSTLCNRMNWYILSITIIDFHGIFDEFWKLCNRLYFSFLCWCSMRNKKKGEVRDEIPFAVQLSMIDILLFRQNLAKVMKYTI